MGKLSLKILGVSVVIFLLGLMCSATGLVSYVAAQGLLTPSAIDPPTAPVDVTTVNPAPTPPPAPSLEESNSEAEANQREYYRGIFDICIATGRRTGHSNEQVMEACQEVVRMAIEQKWFEQPSRGWEWPLPAGLADLDQNG